MKSSSLLLAAALLALLAAASGEDIIETFDSRKCGEIATAIPTTELLEKERCSLCQLIVENSHRWNWGQHYSALCTGVPQHAQEWCMYYACKLSECHYFRSDTCKVVDSEARNEWVEMSPCPSKYICAYCLQVPRTQIFGCFDGSLEALRGS